MKSQIKFWIAVAITLGIIAGYTFLGFMPLKKNIDATEKDMHRTELEIEQIAQRIKSIPDMRKQHAQLTRRVASLKKMVLDPDSISSSMNQLNMLCKQFQVQLNSIDFSTDSLLARSRDAANVSSQSFELPLVLEFQGMFLDFGILMDHLNRLPFVICFTDFNLAAQEKTEKIKFSVRAWIRISTRKNNL